MTTRPVPPPASCPIGWQPQALAPAFWGVRSLGPADGVVGHSFGAMLGARFAVGREISAYAGLSGGWQDWFGDAPFPLPLLDIPTLLTWGGSGDLFTQLSDAQWEAMRRPRHRVVFEEGAHWDYLGNTPIPCRTPPSCPGIQGATADLVTMFFARYLPPELATNLATGVPDSLEPPDLVLTPEQEFFAGGFLGGLEALRADAGCPVTLSSATERLLANRRTRETHSLDHPCAWVSRIATRNRQPVGARPAGYHWCDFCFPSRADG